MVGISVFKCNCEDSLGPVLFSLQLETSKEVNSLAQRMTFTYFQQDVPGNVTALTDAQGVIVETYAYDVYGKPAIRDGNGNLLPSSLTPFLKTL